MKVDLFSIGKFTVHTYGLMIAIGVILAVIMGMKRAEKKGLIGEEILNMGIICVIFGFLGAKILFVLENFRQFLKDPLSVIGSSGFVVYGGIIVGVISIIIYCRIKNYSFFRYFDILMPSVSLGQALGRLGCLGAGCCYGKETDAFWGIVFTDSPYAPNNVSLIPTQIISSAGNFVIMIILILFAGKAKKVGDVGALYLLLYGIGRFCIEFLRENEQGGIGPFTTAQLISFVFMAASVLLFIRNRKSRNAEDYEEKVHSIWL